MSKRIYDLLAWPTRTLADLTRRIPVAQQLNVWANERERQWRRRRNSPLVVALAEAGLHEHASRLDEATR